MSRPQSSEKNHREGRIETGGAANDYQTGFTLVMVQFFKNL